MKRFVTFVAFVALVAVLALPSLAVVIPSHSVDLAWSASPTSGVFYNVYRSQTAGACGGSKVGVGVSQLTFNDATVANGQTYFYAISAQNANGESQCSNEVSVSIPNPPGAPSNLSGVVK